MIQSTLRKLSCLLSGKKSTSPTWFSGGIAKICELLIVHTLGMPGCTYPNDSINLSKTTMLTCMPKINFIIHFFLEILHFKESCNLIDWQHFGPWLENQNFVRHAIGGKIITTIIVSILDYFLEKLMTKCFKKSKNPVLGPFCPNLGKNEFYWKKGSCKFLDIPIIYHRAKNQKKLQSHFWEKRRNHFRPPEKQTDRRPS